MGAKKSKMSSSKNVYLEIAINNQNIGRIEIELNDAVSRKQSESVITNIRYSQNWLLDRATLDSFLLKTGL